MKAFFFYLVIFCSLSLIYGSVYQNSRVNRKRHQYAGAEIPNVQFQALTPKGVRISFPHIDGTELFAFHGRLNSPIRYEEPGTITKDLREPNGLFWTFQDDDVILQTGDIINYWIFVQINGIGYWKDGLSWIKQSSIPQSQQHFREVNSYQSTTRCPDVATSTTTIPPHIGNYPMPEIEQFKEFMSTSVRPPAITQNDRDPCECQKEQLGSINSNLESTNTQIQSLQSTIEAIRNEIASLTDLVKNSLQGKYVGSKLLLTGEQVPGKTALESIRSVIVGKLELEDLANNILYATFMNEGIIFEMSSPIDKERILTRAISRLSNSKFKIKDYVDEFSGAAILDIDRRFGVED